MKTILSKLSVSILLPSLITTTISGCVTLFSDFFDNLSWLDASLRIPFVTLLVILLSLLIFFLMRLTMSSHARAHFDLWYLGRFRGFWKNSSGLRHQIENSFYSAKDIKIKVTRGHNLLEDDNDSGLKAILTKLRDDRKTNPVQIDFLLVIPCFKQEHVKTRYNHYSGMKEEKFLETWYLFLQKILSYRSNYLSINVKLYYEDRTCWRYYAFSNFSNNKTGVILLSENDEDSDGDEQSMYKILIGQKNMGKIMLDYFNVIWKIALTPSDMANNIKNSNGFAGGSCKNCNYFSTCSKLVEKYKNEIQELSNK